MMMLQLAVLTQAGMGVAVITKVHAGHSVNTCNQRKNLCGM